MATWQDGGKLYFDTNGGGYVDMNTGQRYYNDGSGSAIAPTVGTAANLIGRWSGQGTPDMTAQQSNQALAGWQPNMIPGNANDYNPFSADKATSLGVNWGGSSVGNKGPAQIGPAGGTAGGGDWGGSGGSGGWGGWGSTANGNMGTAVSGTTLQNNPYLKQMGDVLTQQMTDNFNTKVAPQLSRGAVLAGGFGGSRQGVMEANANNDLQNAIAGGLANLYGNGYNTSTQYDLGLRNNALGYANLDRNINNDNLGWQLTGANFGLGLYDRMLAGDQTAYQTGSTIQDAPLNYWNTFNNAANGLGQGYSTTTGTQSYGSNPLMGAYGGYKMGQSLFSGMQPSTTANSFGGSNSSGWGTGSGFGNMDFGTFL